MTVRLSPRHLLQVQAGVMDSSADAVGWSLFAMHLFKYVIVHLCLKSNYFLSAVLKSIIDCGKPNEILTTG